MVEKHVVVFVGIVIDEDSGCGRRCCGTDRGGGSGRCGGGGRFGDAVGGVSRDDGFDGRDRARATCAFGDDVASDLGGVGGVAGYDVSIVGIRVGVDGAGGFGGR